MDVLSAHQAGCKIAVASLGTALTSEHCRMLASLASNVVLVYDGDSAGGRAALKGIEALKNYDLTIKVCPLPKDTDPDDYIRKYGGEEFLKLIEKAVPFYDFQIENILKINNINILEEKLKAIKLIIPILLGIDNINQRDEYIKKVAQLLKISEENLRLQLKQVGINNKHSLLVKGVKFANNRHTNIKKPSQEVLDAPYKMMTAPVKAQRSLIKLMINNSIYLDYIQSQLSTEHFTHHIYREIFDQFLYLKQQDEEIDLTRMLNRLSEEAKEVFAQLLTEGKDGLELEEKALPDYIECLQEHKYQSQIEKVQRAIEECEKEGRKDEVLQLLVCLQNLKRNSNISSNR
jgi:DNA primase